jgi:uncharacterized lipoprotein YddW (UPF0748 family)
MLKKTIFESVINDVLMTKHKHFFPLFLLFLFCITNNGIAQRKEHHPKNEFRAVWIATVVNIDWPKKSTDSVAKQKEDYLAILDTYQQLNYNAVIVQIRSVGDAFYPSDLAPWSRFLTGKEGKAPEPNYDTLEWMIEEAHKRGFEFHAWLNPYRATFDLNKAQLSPNHDVFKHPEWMISYGGKIYYNPALPQVQDHLAKIVEEVVVKYDIDAIHFDDYFYPYKIKGENFNDTASFKQYGNGMNLEDWRRNNVTTFVHKIHTVIQQHKPWVQFGISPFGVWRNKSVDPKGSDTQSGQTNYDDLYADPLLWMQNKWIDYVLPQLYWSINHKTASYAKLLKWWSENTSDVNLYIGNGTYKIKNDSDKNWNNIHEIPNQIDLTRSYHNVQGNAFYSAKWFINNHKEVTNILQNHHYKYPAIPLPVPRSKHIVIDNPVINHIEIDSTNCTFTLPIPLNTKVRYVMVYSAKKDAKIDINKPEQIIEKYFIDPKSTVINFSIPLIAIDENKSFAFSFIDFYGNESKETIIDLPNED